MLFFCFCCEFGLLFSSTLKLTREIFAFTSKQCQVMDISDEDDAGPWAPGEKKAKWEDHRFGLSKLDVFDWTLNSSFASKHWFTLWWRSMLFLHFLTILFCQFLWSFFWALLTARFRRSCLLGRHGQCASLSREIIAHLDAKHLWMF